MLKGMEFRIYPNRIQETIIQKTFGCSRVVYNSGLALRIEEYKNGNSIGYKETNSMLTNMKRTEEYSWLKEVDSIALQQSLRDLDKAYKNFFAKRASFPKFKSKHNHNKSYRTQNVGGNISVAGKYIKLPKLGYVKAKISMSVNGKINNATIKQVPSGKYFCVLNVEVPDVFYPNNGCMIGLKFINYMSCNTFWIMGLHIAFFNIFNCILMLICKVVAPLPCFSVETFRETEWYFWKINPNVKLAYVLIGILGPLGVEWIYDYLGGLLKKTKKETAMKGEK